MLTFEPIHFKHVMAARELGWGGWEGWSERRLYYLPMLGYAAFLGEALVGIGAVYWIGNPSTGKAIACFALDPSFAADRRSRWVHRRAIEVLTLAQREAPRIYAEPDRDIPKAREFMARLGFVEEAGGEWVRNGCCNSGDTVPSGVIRDGERDGDCERGRGPDGRGVDA